MRCVAVGAHRRLQVTFGDALAMGAALELIVDLGVACAAGFGNVRLKGGAVGIFVALNAVGSMAALQFAATSRPSLLNAKP